MWYNVNFEMISVLFCLCRFGFRGFWFVDLKKLLWMSYMWGNLYVWF